LRANILHPILQTAQVETAFDDGRRGEAVLEAFREMERLVRRLAGDPDSPPVALMEVAFAPTIGPLSDPTTEIRAQLSTQRLFVESFLMYRSDAEHAAAPDVEAQAVEGVLVADSLARELARVAERHGAAPAGATRL
jgi:hypothetical protein